MKQTELSEFWQIITGYQRSRVLFTLVELRIPHLLNQRPAKTSQLAEILKIHPLAMERFLNSCVSVGLLEKTGTEFSNSVMVEKLFSEKSEFDLSGIIRRHSKRSYAVWENLTESLKSWQYGETATDAPEDEDQGAAAMAEQHNLALMHGKALAETFDFSNYEKLLDLGGGTGAMSIALCEAFPNLKAIVFDLPENAERATDFVEKSSARNRIECVGGDFHTDDLPDAFDVVLLANFMAVADAESNQKLLKRIYAKLPAGGACLLSGWIIDDSHTAPETSVLFCLEDICWNAPDVERSEKTYQSWLEKAGFNDLNCRTYLSPTKILSGFKP